MTVAIDCNIFVMCLTSHSPYHLIYKSLINNEFRLVVSADILLEYEEVIQQKYSVPTANALVTLLGELENVDYIHPNFRWQLITKDPDDNKYCDCAIAGQADYIITEDRHFDVLKNVSFPSLYVWGIDRFMKFLQENK